MIHRSVERLKTLSVETRAALPRGIEPVTEHDRVMETITAFSEVETGGTARADGKLSFPFKIVAWNLERCLFPEASAEHIARENPAVVLLSEMDNGMARTAQRNTIAEVASHLSMQYAYGVEFLELGLGSDTELEFAKDDFNDKGYHGNGLMTAIPFESPFLIRLWGERLWRKDKEQPRIGERMAVGAIVETEAGRLVIVSTHLESATTAAYRERQMTDLIDRLLVAFPELPIVIGGDLNTGNHAGGDFEAEGLFARAAERGFKRHGGPLDVMSTRPSLITRWPERAMKLDWFLTRGIEVESSLALPSLDPDGRPLSDHDMIRLTVSGFDRQM